MAENILREIERTAEQIADAEKKLYDEAPREIAANMRRYMRLKEKYGKLIGRYYGE